MNPDLIITFGTGIVKPYIFNASKWGTINIHRGQIDKYRGLDSDLWAIKNKDFDKQKGGKIKGESQTEFGEYYTAMSLEEKYLTEDIFNDYKLYDNE